MDWTAVFGEESDSLLTDPHLSRGDTEGLSFPDKPEPLFLETSSRSTPLDLLVFSSQLLQLSLKSFILICYKSVEQRIPRSRHSGGHSDWFYESVERFFFFFGETPSAFRGDDIIHWLFHKQFMFFSTAQTYLQFPVG